MDDEIVYKSTSQGKWDCVPKIFKKILEELKSSSTMELQFKPLECERGYLVHTTMTYTVINSFLKGLHQTWDSLRPNQEEDDWNMSYKDYLDKLAMLVLDKEREMLTNAHSIGHPPLVTANCLVPSDVCVQARKWYHIN